MPHIKNPEQDPPSDEQLITIISRKPQGMTLREVCGACWPDLVWYSLNPNGDSAAQRIRADGKTAAQQLLERLQGLVSQGLLREGPPRRDEVDALAAHLFFGPEGPAAIQAPARAEEDGRRVPHLPGMTRRRRQAAGSGEG